MCALGFILGSLCLDAATASVLLGKAALGNGRHKSTWKYWQCSCQSLYRNQIQQRTLKQNPLYFYPKWMWYPIKITTRASQFQSALSLPTSSFGSLNSPTRWAPFHSFYIVLRLGEAGDSFDRNADFSESKFPKGNKLTSDLKFDILWFKGSIRILICYELYRQKFPLFQCISLTYCLQKKERESILMWR